MANTDKAKPVDRFFYVMVLNKLKHLMTDGSFIADEVRYIYGWDTKRSKRVNIENIQKEDAALRYFEQIKLVNAHRTFNEFRKEGRKVWGKSWDETDPAHREHDWVVGLYGIDNDKFTGECDKFGLVDMGIELAEKPSLTANINSPLPLPPTVVKFDDKFSIHQSDVITYKEQIVELEPQVRKMIAFIMKRSAKGLYTNLDSIIDSCLSEQYLAKAEKSQNEDLVANYIRRSISKARGSFRIATNAGQEKDYLPSKSGIGYIFKP